MRRYKLLNILRRDAKTLAVGSSTSMQLRASMFQVEDDFYNAGGLIHRPEHLLEFASLVREGSIHPEVIYLGVDMWWFNKNYPPPSMPALDELSKGFGAKAEFSGWLTAFQALRNQRSAATSLFEAAPANTYGIASRQRTGFRGSDGSMKYRARVEGPWMDPAGTLKRIQTGTRRFQPSTGASTKTANILRTFLKTMKEHEIEVRGFSIPLEQQVVLALKASETHRHLLVEYRRASRAAFKAFDMPYTDSADAGYPGEQMVDGFHGNEANLEALLKELTPRRHR